MSIRIFNTLGRCQAPFVPLTPGKVKIYVCGPTVYDDPHLGHARSAVVFDVIARYLGIRGYHVTLVRNLADIDDKILQRARKEKRDYRTLTARYTRRYQKAMAALNVRPPDAEPKATEFILPIQDFIQRLIQRGHAYSAAGGVYFNVASFKH